MKQIWNIISVFVIALLVLPAGVFASSQNLQNSVQQTVISFVQTVKVVNVAPEQKVVIDSLNQTAQSSNCTVKETSANNLLQSASGINLNQPASCYSLVLTPKFVPLPSLSVVQVQPLVKIIVPSQNRIAQAPSFAPVPIQQGNAIPSLIFIVSAVVLVEQRKSIKKAAVRLLESFAHNLTLHQLGVLRC